MSRLFLSAVFACIATTSFAHYPDRKNTPVRQNIDVIGPIGARLPLSHRRKYNRPTKIGGYLAYLTAPSSQEAMAWHNAKHRGNYDKKMGRTEMQYFYPKPWEILNVGAKSGTDEATEETLPATSAQYPSTQYQQATPEPMPSRYAPLQPPAPLPAPAPQLQTPDTSNLPQSVIDVLGQGL